MRGEQKGRNWELREKRKGRAGKGETEAMVRMKGGRRQKLKGEQGRDKWRIIIEGEVDEKRRG